MWKEKRKKKKFKPFYPLEIYLGMENNCYHVPKPGISFRNLHWIHKEVQFCAAYLTCLVNWYEQIWLISSGQSINQYNVPAVDIGSSS